MVYFEREAKVSFAGFFGAELIMLCVISDVMVGRMARPGVLGGQEPRQKFTEPPPSALEFLKIFVHCRHSRNLLVMLLESAVAF